MATIIFTYKMGATTNQEFYTKIWKKIWENAEVANWSDLDWSMVEHYFSLYLADDWDDEKRLEKTEREAKYMQPISISKEVVLGWKESTAGVILADPVSRKEPLPVVQTPPISQGQFRPHVLGPCFSCGDFGHQAKIFSKKSLSF